MTIECHFQAKHRGGASEFLPDTPFKLAILCPIGAISFAGVHFIVEGVAVASVLSFQSSDIKSSELDTP